MFELKNNVVEFNKKIVLSNQQLAKMNQLKDAIAKQFYIQSLMGLSRQSLWEIRDAHLKYLVPVRANNPDNLAKKAPGQVLGMFNKLLDNRENILHKPMMRAKNSFWVGIEIECLFPNEGRQECEYCGGSGEIEHDCGDSECGNNGTSDQCDECGGTGGNRDGDDLKSKIRQALRDAKITNCSVKNDGSLEGEDLEGVEVTVLMDLRHGFNKLYKVCSILNSMGASVNSSCGLHVHIDQGLLDSDSAKLNGKKLGRFLPILGLLVPKSRRSSTYCKLGVSRIDGDRYYAVNMTSYRKHKTIEVRLHSGSTDARKIEAWVQLLRKIVELPEVPSRNVTTFQDLLDNLSLSPELVAHFDKRFQKFNPDNATAPETQDEETQGQDMQVEEYLGPEQICSNNIIQRSNITNPGILPEIGARFSDGPNTYEVTGRDELLSTTFIRQVFHRHRPVQPSWVVTQVSSSSSSSEIIITDSSNAIARQGA